VELADAVRTVDSADSADAFLNAADGDEIILSSGMCNEWDGISFSMLSFGYKVVDFTCTADDRSCIW